MKSRKDEVLDALRANPNEQTAQELAEQLGVDRTNVSRYLNELTKDGKVKKIDGRPVKFQLTTVSTEGHINFDNLIGREDSLKSQIQKSKAAILYPPRGLHTIIFGETGTGKTMFAECMYRFAVCPLCYFQLCRLRTKPSAPIWTHIWCETGSIYRCRRNTGWVDGTGRWRDFVLR